MPDVSVSKDVLLKVKTALNDYHIDISGFASRVEQQSTDISKSAKFEIDKIARQIEETEKEIDQLKVETRSLHNEITRIQERIPQLERKTREAQHEKSRREDALRAAERRLGRLKNKQDKMSAAYVKLNDNMETMLSASKSFETGAMSKAEQSIGNISKCIAAINAYLS